MDLIVCVSGEKQSWNHPKKLMEKGNWGKIIVIADREASKSFTSQKKSEIIAIDEEIAATDLISHLQKELQKKNLGFEVGLNLVCGSGKEHMVILSSLLKLGVGIRLVALTKDGVVEL